MYRETEGKLGQAQKPVEIEEPKPTRQEEKARERPKEAERSREREVSERSRGRIREKENRGTQLIYLILYPIQVILCCILIGQSKKLNSFDWLRIYLV